MLYHSRTEIVNCNKTRLLSIGVYALVISLVSSLALGDTARAASRDTAQSSLRNVVVVMSYWDGIQPDTTRVAEIVNTIDGPVNEYYSKSSSGAIGFRVSESRDWVKVARPLCDAITGKPDWSGYNQAVRNATGLTDWRGQHLVMYIPLTQPCGESIGGTAYRYGHVGGGGSVFIFDTSAGTIGHELGHTLGLGHAGSLSCARNGVVVVDAAWNNCLVSEYGDHTNIMGESGADGGYGLLNASNLLDLGVPFRSVNAETSGSYEIDATSVQEGVRALTLVKDGSTYWIELVANTGRESWIGGSDPRAPSVQIRKSTENLRTQLADGSELSLYATYLLAAGSSRGRLTSPTMPKGEWIRLVEADAWVMLSSLGEHKARVEVAFGSRPTYTAASLRAPVSLNRETLWKNITKMNSSRSCTPQCRKSPLLALGKVLGLKAVGFPSVDALMRRAGYSTRSHPIWESAPVGAILIWREHGTKSYRGGVYLGGDDIAVYNESRSRIEIASRSRMPNGSPIISWLEPDLSNR